MVEGRGGEVESGRRCLASSGAHPGLSKVDALGMRSCLGGVHGYDRRLVPAPGASSLGEDTNELCTSRVDGICHELAGLAWRHQLALASTAGTCPVSTSPLLRGIEDVSPRHLLGLEMDCSGVFFDHCPRARRHHGGPISLTDRNYRDYGLGDGWICFPGVGTGQSLHLKRAGPCRE